MESYSGESSTGQSRCYCIIPDEFIHNRGVATIAYSLTHGAMHSTPYSVRNFPSPIIQETSMMEAGVHL